MIKHKCYMMKGTLQLRDIRILGSLANFPQKMMPHFRWNIESFDFTDPARIKTTLLMWLLHLLVLKYFFGDRNPNRMIGTQRAN